MAESTYGVVGRKGLAVARSRRSELDIAGATGPGIIGAAMSAPSASNLAHRRLPAGWRWLGIGMRSVHLGAVVLLGTALLGAPARLPAVVIMVALLVTGLALLALETWKTPSHFLQLAGASMVAKLGIVAWMIGDAAHAELAFWLVTVWSVVFAHAPASVRHRRIDALWRGR